MSPATEPEQKPRAPLGVGKRGGFNLGPVGATAVVGGAVALTVALVLALTIPDIVEQDLLEAEATSIKSIIDEIAIAHDSGEGFTDDALALLQTQVERSLLGHEIVRVKIWDATGTIVFSDEARLIGNRYEAPDSLPAAFSGQVTYEKPDLSRPENEYERGFGDLREYYIPVDSGTQGVEIVFEVYELASHVDNAVTRIRSAVWTALGLGSIVLMTALTAATITNVRAERRSKSRSERLISQLLGIQEHERMRIIGALHDDIGQPLYRILFGLQASRRTVGKGSAVDDELESLETLAREMDSILRSELKGLRDEPGVEIDLESALAELAEVVEAETGLDIDFEADVETELPLPHRATLFRAAKEALTNVDRHAHADHATMRLVEGRDSTMIEVIDDGAGITAPPGLGLTTTRDRLEAIGGGIEVTDAKGAGTRFAAWVPLRPAGQR